MELTHTFTVPAPVEETWAAFGDIGSIAECFPGATVSSVEGGDFVGSCKVRLGPISLVYDGTGTFVERDEAARRLVVEVKGKDKRGNGTAGAKVTATMTEAHPGNTEVSLLTDLSVTGKPAQLGRGVTQDVSDELLQQFVDCLAGKVRTAVAAAEDRPSGAETAVGAAALGEMPVGHVRPTDVAASQVGEAAEAAAAGVPGATAGGPPATTRPSGTSAGQPAASGSQDVLDLGTTLLPALARAYWKPALSVLLALLVLRRLVSRRRH